MMQKNKKSKSLVFGYNKRQIILGSGVIITVLLLFVVGFGEVERHNKASIFINGNKVEGGGIRIDNSGNMEME